MQRALGHVSSSQKYQQNKASLTAKHTWPTDGSVLGPRGGAALANVVANSGGTDKQQRSNMTEAASYMLYRNAPTESQIFFAKTLVRTRDPRRTSGKFLQTHGGLVHSYHRVKFQLCSSISYGHRETWSPNFGVGTDDPGHPLKAHFQFHAGR